MAKSSKNKTFLKKGLRFAMVYVLVKWLIIGLVGTWLYQTGNWDNKYLLVLPIIGGIVFMIRK
ncbi:MAG: hypothetical protein AAF806_10230 [Bacteroidota bacterium]